MAKSRANRASPSRPYEVLFQMVIGKWISQALGTVVEIGVPEQLAKGARRRSTAQSCETAVKPYRVCFYVPPQSCREMRPTSF
jgi:hypothetical protein